MDNFYDPVGERIRQLRKQYGYTREELAELAEISSKFLYEIEKGRKGFSANTLYRIAKGLSVPYEYILEGKMIAPLTTEMIEYLLKFDPNNLCEGTEISELLYTIIGSNASVMNK